jgi:hypothetical protein
MMKIRLLVKVRGKVKGKGGKVKGKGRKGRKFFYPMTMYSSREQKGMKARGLLMLPDRRCGKPVPEMRGASAMSRLMRREEW